MDWTGKRIRTKVTDVNEVDLANGWTCDKCGAKNGLHKKNCVHRHCTSAQCAKHACGSAEVDIPIGWTGTVDKKLYKGHPDLGQMYAIVWDDDPNAPNPDRTTSNMGWTIWGEKELERDAELLP